MKHKIFSIHVLLFAYLLGFELYLLKIKLYFHKAKCYIKRTA
jgi:hypothetical protein